MEAQAPVLARRGRGKQRAPRRVVQRERLYSLPLVEYLGMQPARGTAVMEAVKMRVIAARSWAGKSA